MPAPFQFIEQIVPLDRIGPDPLIPPRISPETSLPELVSSLEHFGLLQPLILRPAVIYLGTRVDLGLVAGGRRLLAMRALGWTNAKALIGPLPDADALRLALDMDEQSLPRTKLEQAWFFARLAASGVEQQEIAETYKMSTGKTSMYVRVGAGLPPELLRDADVPLDGAARVAITRLRSIAKEPVATRAGLVTAAAAASQQPAANPSNPVFGFRSSSKGRWTAMGESGEVAGWPSTARTELIATVGPLVDLARAAEGLVSPHEVSALAEQETAHQLALLALREQHAAEIRSYTEQILRLATLLEGTRPGNGSSDRRWRQHAAKIQHRAAALYRTLRHILRLRFNN